MRAARNQGQQNCPVQRWLDKRPNRKVTGDVQAAGQQGEPETRPNKIQHLYP